MSWLRHTHAVALVLLSVQVTVLVRAVVLPSAAACACSHGEGVDCDCPAHAGAVAKDRAAFTEAEWAKLPPCHKAMYKARAPLPKHEGGPELKSRCHTPDEGLFLLAAAPPPSLPKLPRPPAAHVLARIAVASSSSVDQPARMLLRPPIA